MENMYNALLPHYNFGFCVVSWLSFFFFRDGCVVYCPDINVFMPRHCCWRICCSCCCCSCNCSCCGRADCVLNCSGIKFCMHFIAVAAKQMTHMGNPIHFEYENSVPKCICSRELKAIVACVEWSCL